MAIKQSNAKMTSHVCVSRKGPMPNWRLEFSAEGADSAQIHEGSLVSLDSTGKFVLGCGVGTKKNIPMPMWVLQGVEDAGTIVYGNNAFAGNFNALVATGGYEIETSEFDTTATYAINDAIVPMTGSDAGKVTVAATTDLYAAKPIVGIVTAACSAAAPTKNEVCEIAALRFWSVFFPAKNA